jgi:hypothetical protein
MFLGSDVIAERHVVLGESLNFLKNTARVKELGDAKNAALLYKIYSLFISRLEPSKATCALCILV